MMSFGFFFRFLAEANHSRTRCAANPKNIPPRKSTADTALAHQLRLQRRERRAFACTESQRERTRNEQRVAQRVAFLTHWPQPAHFNFVSVVGACSRHMPRRLVRCASDSAQHHDTAMIPAAASHCVCALLTCVRRSQQPNSRWAFSSLVS